MSHPHYGWWGYAKHMIRRWPDRVNENEYAAVAAAIAETERMKTGADRMKVVRTVLLEGSRTLELVAMDIPCSERTAQRYHADFIRAVGKYFKCEGLYDPQEGKKEHVFLDKQTRRRR